ncbi:MAG: response regulator [Candidatus Aureabacteria bacterium]|nr:response regulator [Cyclobacteriaceae bacterium]MCK5708223.1 response regulator [Candidatus Auribacterota bacterium]
MAKILIVDDSLWWRKRMSKLVESMGHEIMTLGCVENTLNALNLSLPDCIITDLIMPDGEGFQIVEAVNKKNPQIPVIVLTADFQEETIKRCKELGAFEVIQKELVKKSLADIVTRALEKS